MLLPDGGEPADGVVPGLIGPLNPRLPSVRDGEPPMPARTQKYVPPASDDLTRIDSALTWVRVALVAALFTIAMLLKPAGWVIALLLLALCAIPDRALQRLLPKSLRQQPTLIQTDSGDTWITHVPSVRVEADPTTIRLPFRVMSGVVALLFMLVAMLPAGDLSLFTQLASFLGGVVFGSIALVPAGDLRRMLPRISTGPQIPARADDADAGEAGGADSRTHGED